ncbi:GTPase ObgE [Candidatus Cerribacteria bacterium 'Amazon FNV 2010 28 9']|uniref:GTPase Obg n=1 Tax=Candidatus Cerribacteria bacterium 'Amazon FNV 2010 28 9' TaxID=2081795 RepID=A0A317JM95_9BACT|nr:MAG: GTPase ObgE [Candidatus Cerribacteria bacterium 'Amazon FNV 2010 28 9']
MVDLTPIYISAGDGGDGRISFLRTRYQQKGGPDGGDGGKGGSVILRADQNVQTLRDFSGKKKIEAKNGQTGGAYKQHGKDMEDVYVRLPVGTAVWRSIADFEPMRERRMYTIDEEGERKEWKRTGRDDGGKVRSHILTPTKRAGTTKMFSYHGSEVEAEFVTELLHHDDERVIARGGYGGRGNFQFRSSSHTTPRDAETGESAEKGLFFFELQSLADVGLVGFPNIGKSTLLSVLTNASPQVANYPFTTLEPNLGILQFDGKKAEERDSYVVADIPGIIEGASEGKGLGIAFLRHIERCRVLVIVLALDEYAYMEQDSEQIVQHLEEQYRQVEHELDVYEKASEQELEKQGTNHVPLSEKQRIIVLGKADLLSDEQKQHVASAFHSTPRAFFISGKTLEGIATLKNKLHEMLRSS